MRRFLWFAMILVFAFPSEAREGNGEASIEDLETQLATAGDEDQLEILTALGGAHGKRGQLEIGRRYYDQAVTLARRLDDQPSLAEALRLSSRLSRYLGDLQSARQTLTEISSLSEARIGSKQVAMTLNERGLLHRDEGNYETSIELHTRAGKEAEDGGHLSYVLITLMDAGDAHARFGHLDLKLASYEQAVALSRGLEANDLSFALYQLGNLYEHVDQLAQAGDILLEAIEVAETLDDTDRLIQNLNKLGSVHRKLHRWEEALALHYRALRLVEQSGTQNHLGSVLNRIAIVYDQTGRFDEALALYRRVLELAEANEDRGRITTALANIGSVYNQLGDHDRALEILERSLSLRKELGNEEKLARGLAAVGETYYLLDEPERAEPYLQESLEIWNRLGSSKEEIAFVMGSLGTIHRQLNRFEESRIALEQTVELITKAGIKAQQTQSLRELATTYEAMGRLQDALDTFSRYEEVLIEELKSKNRRTVHEMQSRFDAEQKTRDIELLEHRQELGDLELTRQRDRSTAQTVAFGLIVGILLLLFNRYRLKTQQSHLQETMKQERELNVRLRSIDKLKDDFLANTSHELRTPLYGMIGLAESLIEGAGGDISLPMKKNLSMIVTSGRRLSHLVNDILDFSKLRHKALELSLRPVELHAVVDVVLTLSQPLAGGKPLSLDNSVAADLPHALADENRVQQILFNLIGNAIKFTEKGFVKVEAHIDNEHLVICVNDSGIGIPKHKQEQVFQAFEQADASIERKFGGTGLGLALTRQLVELHGGSLWLESSPEGSHFYFSLPVAPASSEDPSIPDTDNTQAELSTPRSPILEPESPRVHQSEGEGSAEERIATGEEGHDHQVTEEKHPGAVRILVVDDEPINRQILKNFLPPEQFDLATAPSGEEALRLIREQDFDLVLLDVMMPRISGFEVCRSLRELHSMEDLPVLFLTAKNQPSDVATGLSLGANDYLPKPIGKEELLARIRPHLDLLDINHRLKDLVEEQLSQITVLEGILPICSYCKKIRDSEDEWHPMESYIDRHSEAHFSHGICPTCVKQHWTSNDQ